MCYIIRLSTISIYIVLFFCSLAQYGVEISDFSEISEKEYLQAGAKEGSEPIWNTKQNYALILKHRFQKCSVYIRNLNAEPTIENAVDLSVASEKQIVHKDCHQGFFLIKVGNEKLVLLVCEKNNKISKINIIDYSTQSFWHNHELDTLEEVIFHKLEDKDTDTDRKYTIFCRACSIHFDTHYFRLQFTVINSSKKSSKKRKHTILSESSYPIKKKTVTPRAKRIRNQKSLRNQPKKNCAISRSTTKKTQKKIIKASQIQTCTVCKTHAHCLHCNEELIVTAGKKCKSCKAITERYCTHCYTKINQSDTEKFDPKRLRENKIGYLKMIVERRKAEIPVCKYDFCTGYKKSIHMLPHGVDYKSPPRYRYMCYGCGMLHYQKMPTSKPVRIGKIGKPKKLVPSNRVCRKCHSISRCPHCQSSVVEIRGKHKCKICKSYVQLYCEKCFIVVSKHSKTTPERMTEKEAQEEIDKLGKKRGMRVPNCPNGSCTGYNRNLHMKGIGTKRGRYNYICKACSRHVQNKQVITK